MASTSWCRAPKWSPVRRMAGTKRRRGRQLAVRRNPDEPFPAIYLAAGRDRPADGRHSAGRHGGLSAVAGLGIAAGRLSHDSSADVLSRRQPYGDGLVHHVAAGAPVRSDSRADPDDVEQLGRLLGDYAALRLGPEY